MEKVEIYNINDRGLKHPIITNTISWEVGGFSEIKSGNQLFAFPEVDRECYIELSFKIEQYHFINLPCIFKIGNVIFGIHFCTYEVFIQTVDNIYANSERNIKIIRISFKANLQGFNVIDARHKW